MNDGSTSESGGAPSVAPAAKKAATSLRVPEIDLLRFVAAASVVIYHFTYLPRVNGVVDERAFNGLQQVTQFGFLGVNLFFIISGFVILWSSRERSAKAFVVSRVARLYPSFWTCACLTALVVYLGGGPDKISARELLLNLTMVPGLLHVPLVDGVYWTLLVELKFYVLIFLVLVAGGMKHIELLVAAWLACAVTSAMGLSPGWLSSLTMYRFGPFFIGGCVLYLIRADGPSLFKYLMLVAACGFSMHYGIEARSGFISRVTPGSSMVVGGVILVFYLVFLTVALRPGILPASKWWYLLGSLTYPLYLLHNRIGRLIVEKFHNSPSPWISFLVELAIVAALSSAVAAIVERRVCSAFQRALTRWTSRLPDRRPASVPAA